MSALASKSVQFLPFPLRLVCGVYEWRQQVTGLREIVMQRAVMTHGSSASLTF